MKQVALAARERLMKQIARTAIAVLLLTGCAGMSRDCSSCWASSTGGDWIVVQYRFDGTPINCWQLRNTPVSNEQGTDGVYWQDRSGHLVHISGWYNRVQVQNERWAEAASAIGVDDSRCKNGVYRAVDAALDGGPR